MIRSANLREPGPGRICQTGERTTSADESASPCFVGRRVSHSEARIAEGCFQSDSHCLRSRTEELHCALSE